MCGNLHNNIYPLYNVWPEKSDRRSRLCPRTKPRHCLCRGPVSGLQEEAHKWQELLSSQGLSASVGKYME